MLKLCAKSQYEFADNYQIYLGSSVASPDKIFTSWSENDRDHTLLSVKILFSDTTLEKKKKISLDALADRSGSQIHYYENLTYSDVKF